MTGFEIYMLVVFLGMILTISLFLVEINIKNLGEDHKFKIWWRRNVIKDSDEDF